MKFESLLGRLREARTILSRTILSGRLFPSEEVKKQKAEAERERIERDLRHAEDCIRGYERAIIPMEKKLWDLVLRGRSSDERHERQVSERISILQGFIATHQKNHARLSARFAKLRPRREAQVLPFRRRL
ncbi:MAG TPA: hypothetical protein VI957_01220 [Candidatus Paceibacterota bacterium]